MKIYRNFCRSCNIEQWSAFDYNEIDGCPNCMGKKVVKTEDFPTEKAAMEVWLKYQAYVKAELEKARDLI